MRHGITFARTHASARGGEVVRAGIALAAIASLFASAQVIALSTTKAPPPTLQETGLYADVASLAIDPPHLAFSPQYPLWTDGATKRRWISLPPGGTIDASDPDAWVFPVGTRLWKEFSFAGRPIETRYIERRADGSWLYAAYAWSADGRTAELVSDKGKRDAFPLAGGRAHAIPGVNDCKACHEGGRSQVLGFSALQLSPDRDPGAPHAEPRPEAGVDLATLVDKGLVVGLRKTLRERAPRIAATSAVERSALGYMHGNCGHCHNAQGPLRNLGLVLRQSVGSAEQAAIATTVGAPVKEPAPGQSPEAQMRVSPQHPDRSALLQRIGSRYPPLQMPPLGTELIDRDAVELIRRWIDEVTTPRNTPQEQKGT